MKSLATLLLLFIGLTGKAQWADSLIGAHNTLLKKIVTGDSIVYYQCHVEEATQQLSTASGQTIQGTAQKYTITEKYVLTKTSSGFVVKYYTSSLSVFPNKKFSGLKIRERPYWQFVYVKTYVLTENFLRILLALEKKGREATEFDFGITKYTTNQLILKHRKDFKQLVIDGNYVLSKGLEH